MKRTFAWILVFVCLLPLIALGEGKITVTQKNLYAFLGTDKGWFFAKIENTGDAPIGVDSGSLVLFSPDDEIILTENYIVPTQGRIILQPGEMAYIQRLLWEDALKDTPVGDYKFSVKGGDMGNQIVRIPCEAALELNDVESEDSFIHVTFTNASDQLQADFHVSVALSDAEGNLLFVEGETAKGIAVHPGSTVTMSVFVPNNMLRYYKAEGIVPLSAEAIVSYRK